MGKKLIYDNCFHMWSERVCDDEGGRSFRVTFNFQLKTVFILRPTPSPPANDNPTTNKFCDNYEIDFVDNVKLFSAIEFHSVNSSNLNKLLLCLNADVKLSGHEKSFHN